jgi:alkylation response protein AidB-like acyl-CoA dehydrogenase
MCQCSGGLEKVIQQTIDYAKERTTFGQPLINNQYVHFRFAELMTEVEALKALTYQACEQHIAGKMSRCWLQWRNSNQGVSLVKSLIAVCNIGAAMALCGITLLLNFIVMVALVQLVVEPMKLCWGLFVS